MKRSRELDDDENIPACIVVLKPHHSNFAREGQKFSSHGDGSTFTLHPSCTPENTSSSFSTAATVVNSSHEVLEVLDSSSKGIQPADCFACGVSEPSISDRPGIIVHGNGGNLGEEPKERRRKEKRKKHRPKVVEIEKPEQKSKIKTINSPKTPKQESLGRRKGRVIGMAFTRKKMVADSLGDENDREETDDRHRPASANKPVIPSSRIQIDGDEWAAKINVEPSSCSGNAQMAWNSVAGAAQSSTDVNISIDELLQELAKYLKKPLSPLLLKEELLQLNMVSFVDALKYIVDNINLPHFLYSVYQSRRIARSRLKVGHKLKDGLDHSTNNVLEKFIYVLMKFLPFLFLNNDLSQSASRKSNNRQSGGGRKNIIRLKEQQNTPKKSIISKVHSNLQIIPSTHQQDCTSRFQCMEALQTATAHFTINGKLTASRQNISRNCKELALENIIDMFRVLDINKVYGKDVPAEPYFALVPFVGDGMIVPYDGPFEKNKQKHCRAEVLLDPVSDSVLKILQENEGGDDVEGMDCSMVKWWENERRVFVGRAESFIARMNLVLGDRQFSPWKGSIVDSVIGVFLTQNVSDHLSSSAFMSLAAKFPLHSRFDEGSSSECKLSGKHEEKSNDAITLLNDIPNLSNCDDQDSAFIQGDGRQEMDLASQSYNHQNFMGSNRIENCENFIKMDVEGCITKHAASLSNSFVVNAENECRDLSQVLSQSVACSKLNNGFNDTVDIEKEVASSCSKEQMASFRVNKTTLRPKKKVNTDGEAKIDWECLRKKAYCNIDQNKRNCDRMNSVNWEAVRNADVSEISAAIRERGMNNLLAERIKDFLNRLVRDHGSIDLEWLRNICPDEAKKFLLSIRGLGLKSVECIRLLALQDVAFPVDTNVARISVRLGWVPLKPLPEFLQLHLLEQYPIMDSVQKYIWPRLCKLDQKTLYQLHYHMITFGKVFCTKSRPNCRVCPMRGECKHFSSAKPALPAPEDMQVELPLLPAPLGACSSLIPIPQLQYEESKLAGVLHDNYSPTPIIEEPPPSPTPIIEEPPPSPSHETIQILETDIEDAFYEDDEIPAIMLNMENLSENYQNFVQEDNLKVPESDISRALVEISAEVASIRTPKLKNVSGLRTEHHVYELRDSHPLLKEMDEREPDDQFPYLLAIWTPGETAQSTEPPETFCESLENGKLCDREICFSCNSRRELAAQTVRGTILIPCRTAMRGRFPLNGTYFQINEVFADHDSSHNPIHVPRSWLWNLPRRTVYFGTSVAAIFRGFSDIEPIQYCFSRGFICVRGFDMKTREPKPLYARLHLPRSKAPNNKKPWARQEE